MSEGPNRPAVRYHGGKWLLARWILSHFPPHRFYTEAYGGGASVLLQKERSHAEVYNDLDGEMVNLFAVIRDNANALTRAIAWTPFSRVEFIGSYKPCSDPLELARRTVVRSFMGFGSAAVSGNKTGFRAKSNRSGTTPARDWANFPRNIRPLSRRLRGVVLEQRDAVEVIQCHDEAHTLHYVDPPYVHDTRCLSNPYCKKGYRHEMSDEQHIELAKVLAGVRGMVVLSGYRSDLYAELYRSWQTVERQAHADGARDRTEILWLNDAAAAALAAQRETGLFGDVAA